MFLRISQHYSMTMVFRNITFALFIIIVASLLWTCDRNGCSLPHTCHVQHEFLINYQIGNGQDTFQVGDTIDFFYEIPYFIADNDQGLEFDVRERLESATELWFCTLDFDNNIFNNPRPGDFGVFDQLVGDTIFNVSNNFRENHYMYRQKLEDREVSHLKIVPYRADSYILFTALNFYKEEYIGSGDAKVYWQDTCCAQSAVFRHIANVGENNMEVFTDTSGWAIENEPQYGWEYQWEGHGPYYFAVVE